MTTPEKARPSARDILKRPYARILIPEEDGGYSAEMLEFPGCYAEGETPAEAVTELEKAAESWVDVMLEHNRAIPEPLANYDYSGKINLRLPRSIHKQAACFAQKDDVSLNQFFVSAIAASVGAEDLCERLIERIRGTLIPTISTVQIVQVVSPSLGTFTLPSLFGWSLNKQSPYIHLENHGPVTTVDRPLPQRAITNG
jgi:predicted RNase H-like HicB family nuclease